jgi:hypothetical protein
MEELGNVEWPFVDDRLDRCESRLRMYKTPCSVLSARSVICAGVYVLVEEVEQADTVLGQVPSKPTAGSR